MGFVPKCQLSLESVKFTCVAAALPGAPRDLHDLVDPYDFDELRAKSRGQP